MEIGNEIWSVSYDNVYRQNRWYAKCFCHRQMSICTWWIFKTPLYSTVQLVLSWILYPIQSICMPIDGKSIIIELMRIQTRPYRQNQLTIFRNLMALTSVRCICMTHTNTKCAKFILVHWPIKWNYLYIHVVCAFKTFFDKSPYSPDAVHAWSRNTSCEAAVLRQ